MMISDNTRKLLQRSGWNSERHVDISNHVAALEDDGYTVHEVVRGFLTEFAGLRILHPHASNDGTQDEFRLVPEIALDSVYPERVAEYGKRSNSRPVPVGEAFRGHMVLLMDEYGRVFAGYDDLLIRVGSSGEDALNNLCLGNNMPKME